MALSLYWRRYLLLNLMMKDRAGVDVFSRLASLQGPSDSYGDVPL